MEPASQNILFVINPNSGSGARQNYETQIREFFKPLDHTVDYYHLTGTDDTAGIKKMLKNFKAEKMVAVGGDGTLNLVAKIVLNTPIAMGIISAGSANGMAAELKIPAALKDMLELIVNGTIKKADIIKINENDICLHLSDIGLNARLIKYFEEENMRGKLGYAKVALKVLWRKQNIKVIIDNKEGTIKRNAFMVVIANASKYGTGAVINPEGDLYDGLFEVVIIRQLKIFEILKMWIRPMPFNKKNIEIVKASSVAIVTGHRVHFQVDGEYKGKVTKVNAKILPGALSLIAPEPLGSGVK